MEKFYFNMFSRGLFMFTLYFDGFRNVAYQIFESSFGHRDADLEEASYRVLYKLLC